MQRLKKNKVKSRGNKYLHNDISGVFTWKIMFLKKYKNQFVTGDTEFFKASRRN